MDGPIDVDSVTPVGEFLAPATYSGLYGFHKYWGKKPPETVAFLVEQLSAPGELVFDPFLGSGAIARETYIRNRRFVGGDINPVAIDLARLFVAPPSLASVTSAMSAVQSEVQNTIERQYQLQDGTTASHFLWKETELQSVWTKPQGRRGRVEFAPTEHDLALFAAHEGYSPTGLRPLRIHQNSRINARAEMDWADLFTGRAIRSIELLRSAILAVNDTGARQALLLVLTSAVGQMSKMVFAIERRGKGNGVPGTGRIEVGSWVIGLWTPKLRFEVNAWNCFANKAAKLLKSLREESPLLRRASITDDPMSVATGMADVALACLDAHEAAERLPPESVDLILTDPPHGDRMPYLEMSEIWNAVLGHEPRFANELVISNARERGKDAAAYSTKLRSIFETLATRLTNQGIAAVLFNSRSTDEWEVLLGALENAGLAYRGRVPMAYSARSVVQDNRAGALDHDYVAIFSRASTNVKSSRIAKLARQLPAWSSARPQ